MHLGDTIRQVGPHSSLAALQRQVMCEGVNLQVVYALLRAQYRDVALPMGKFAQAESKESR